MCTRVKSSSQWLIQTGISTEMLCLYSFKEGLVTGPLLPSEEGPCLLWKGLRGPLCTGFRPRLGKARGRASPSRSGAMCVQMGPFSTGHLGSSSIPGVWAHFGWCSRSLPRELGGARQPHHGADTALGTGPAPKSDRQGQTQLPCTSLAV